MDVFDLCAKISLDKSEYEKGLDDAKKSTGGFLGVFGKVGTVASAVGKGIFDVTERVVKVSAAATTAGAAAVSALTTLAVNSYAEYEQLVGGVETLYKDSADKVQEYAAIAYKTAGLSANDYMETATSFAAALVSSLAGDTDAAAELANTAVSDMSDNANKFGTDIESLQTAYNGFAKGQFQLLDNLKLGYGGTKQEMQRLLDDANKLNAAQGKYTKYTIDNYADIVQAVHDIQTEMDITGTTAREASSTIQGSTSAAKAAWSNLVTGVADDNADFDLLINNFVDSIGTAALNIIPRIEIALDGAAKLIERMVPIIMDELPKLIETVLPKLADSALHIVQTLVDKLNQNAGKLIDSAITIISTLGRGIFQMLPQVANSALQIILTLTGKLNDNLPKILDTVGEILMSIVKGFAKNLPQIVNAAADIIATLLSYFIDHLPEIVNGSLEMGSAIIEGIMQGILPIGDALSDIKDKVQHVIDFIKPYVSKAMTFIKNVVVKVVNSLKPVIDSIGKAFSAAWDLAKTVWSWASAFFSAIVQAIIMVFSPFAPLISGIFGAAFAAVQTVWGVATSFFQMIFNVITGIFSAIDGVLSGDFSKAWDGIKGIFGGVFSFFSSVGNDVVNGIKSGISSIWGGLTSFVQGLWDGIKGIFTINASDVKNNTGSGSSNRRHAGGLDYVPYNDYVANLHRGEMVLTAREADEYRKNGVQSGTGFVVNQTIYAAKQTPVELAAATRAAFQRARWATV